MVTNEKQPSYRTVEGNLGLRISATGIVETVGPAEVLAKLGRKSDEEAAEITEYVAWLEKNPNISAPANGTSRLTWRWRPVRSKWR